MKLEKRICACGCARQWRCLPTSTSKYYSIYECANQVPNEGRLEFTGKTAPAIKREKKPRKENLNNTPYSRNHSKWDK